MGNRLKGNITVNIQAVYDFTEPLPNCWTISIATAQSLVGA